MDIQQLRIFAEVVHAGSFAAAARHLDMAPSMVTRSVAALERELGMRLMQRTTRKLSMTEAGAAYYEHARSALDALDRASEEAHATQGSIGGTVRVTASVAYGQSVIVPLLPALHEQHPNLQIDLLLTDAVFDLVVDRVDIALRLGPATDSSLVGLQLDSVRYRVVASPEYLERHGRPRVPGDLTLCDCPRYPLPGYGTQWKFRAPDGAVVTVPIRGWLMLSSFLALHCAALDGLGPVLLPEWLLVADFAAGRLVDLFPDHEVTATNFDSAVWLLYASRTHVPRRVRAVIDFIKQTVGRRQPGAAMLDRQPAPGAIRA
jgi:DNA-binding transcriptional LysR family regulator